ncbi:MAG: 6,7-dimethyl-8-ribityllumazine synthase, partial [Treponema sp.]|nr:6,7-dimethyl-8-ribityllumazine synthase [Treponema sp.]
MKEFEGMLTAEGLRFGIIAARFNDFIVSRLVDGARDALLRHGAREDDLFL